MAAAKEKLKLLLVEDSEDDALLLKRELEKGGFDPVIRRVETLEAYTQALDEGGWDLVIGDYVLPAFSGQEALKRLRQRDPDLPFVIVSGVVGEEVAVQTMKAGANDYLLKHNLTRLAPAVRRELRERDLRAEHRASGAALRESEARFHGIFENTSDAVFLVGVHADGYTYDDLNAEAERFLGVRRSEVRGKRLRDILPPALCDYFEGRCQEAISAGRAITYDEQVELASGPSTFSTSLVPLKDAAGLVVRIAGVCRDMTESRRAEERIRQSQKLEGLGLLAGGIAHDFNNLLTALMGNLGLARENPDQVPACLDRMEATVARASDLTRQLLAYSGRGRFIVMAHDLNLVLQDITDLLGVTIPKKVRVDYRLGADLPAVEADSAQLQQVIVNLVTNAADAIGDEEGRILFATRRRILDESDLASRFAGQGLRPGDYAVLEVSDTGCGMAEEVRDRIFDPFFTTKETGRGLGLSAMLGILRSHHAGLILETEPGKGTTFQIYFPASKSAPEAAAAPSGAKPLRSSGLLLLADDEDAVREVTATVLRRMGFEVDTAKDGAEAVERFKARPDQFLAAVLDLTMPRLDGRQAVRQIHALRPDLPVLLTSGYSESEALEGASGLAFLRKPYLARDLHDALAELLGG
ncbi:MAG: response regulator [Acidobacteria bacterium]|nr:response regulator [Acidobacteriota bacterium]